MLNSKLEKAIKEIFSLSAVNGYARAIYEKDGEKFPVMVQLIWVVEILDDYLAGVTAVGVKTKHMNGSPAGYTGVLLVPPIRRPLDRDFGGKNLKPVDMEWPNSIITALESMNIVPYKPSPVLLGSGDDTYRIHTYVGMSSAHIDFRGYPHHKNQQIFWEAIVETVLALGKAMRDREVQKYLDESRDFSE